MKQYYIIGRWSGGTLGIVEAINKEKAEEIAFRSHNPEDVRVELA